MDRDQTEKIVMNALLPGITFAAERAVETLNEARLALGLPPAKLDIPGVGSGNSFPDVVLALPVRKKRGRPPKPIEPAPVQSLEIVDAPPKRKVGARAKRLTGESTRHDWAIVKEAGLKSAGRPSRELVARALKIIERKNGRKQA